MRQESGIVVRTLLGAVTLAAGTAGGVGWSGHVEETETPWVLDCCSPFRQCANVFLCAGFGDYESEMLAHTIMYGAAATLDKPSCSYYFVPMFYCNNGMRYTRPVEVKSLCIEEGLESCPPMICPVGDNPPYPQTFFLTQTSAGCDPPDTCVWLRVSGPFSTNDMERCAELELTDCSCWPEADCDSRVCVPVVGVDRVPRGCPACPP